MTSKEERYEILLPQAAALLSGESDPVARMANLAALIHTAFGFWWTGFYRVVAGRESTPERHGESATEFSEETAPEFSGETASEFSGGTAAEFSGETAMEFSEETAPDFSGGPAMEFPGETATEFSGGTAMDFPGGTATEFSGETAMEFSGETASEFPGGPAMDFSGGPATEFSGETATDFSGGLTRGSIGGLTPGVSGEHCAETLLLGPFQGPVACTRIPYGKGVCGTAWKEARTVIVPDVEQFPGHIACSSESRSEIVVPVIRSGRVTAVLDIDSRSLATFDSTDAHYLELLTALL